MANSFWFQLRKFGITRIFLSADFIFSIALVAIVERLTISFATYHLDYGQILNVLAGLFAFVFAALAILIAMSETKFTVELIKADKYEGLLFHYWFTCNTIVLSIGYVLLAALAKFQNKYLELLAIFFVSYSLCLVLGLIKTTISAGIYQNRLNRHNDDEGVNSK